MHKHHRRTFAHESVPDSGSVDLELPKLHVLSLSAPLLLRESLCSDRAPPTMAVLTRRAN
jgi:hypothetical protein